MVVLSKFRVFEKTLKFFKPLIMSRNGEKVFYAVGRGKETGIYDSWKECKAQTEGIPNAKFRKFYSYEDAEEFVNFWKNYSTPVKETPFSENLVSKVADKPSVNGGEQAHEEKSCKSDKPSKSSHVLCKSKKQNFILGFEASKQGWNKIQNFSSLHYTSPLSGIKNCDFFSFVTDKVNKELRVCSSNVECRNSSTKLNRSRQDDLRGLRNLAEFSDSKKKKREKFKKVSKSDYQNSSGSRLLTQNILSDNLDKTSKAATENVVLMKGFVDENISEQFFRAPHFSCLGKDKDAEVVPRDENCRFQRNEQVIEAGDTLKSYLSLLKTVLNVITKKEADGIEKLKNFLHSLQTVTDTNIAVNPQIETQGTTEMICEDTKYFGKIEPQNADILALNLRLDSFEKRFDACLKEIGAIAAEMSHIKSDIKELKETLSCSSKRGSMASPRKVSDGRVQTTLCFDSNGANHTSVRSYSGRGSAAEKHGVKEGRALKRKLSRSNSTEKSKRFAEDEIDDILSRVIKTEKVDYTSFTLDEDDYVEVYTDGSALSNGTGDAKAGIGVWFGDNHPLNVSEPVVGPPTNNTAEIQAARVAVQLAIKAGITKLKIHTDSEFLINCVTKWIHRWKTNGWTLRDGGPVKNKKELEKLDKAVSKISVRWEKVAAHSNIKGNETADRLANEGAAKYQK